MLAGAVGDRPHRFLDGAILCAESLHAGIRLAARLQRAIDQIIIGAVANGMIRARDIFGVDAEPGLRAGEILRSERPRRMKIDAVEHRVLVVDRRPHMGGVRNRRNDLVERRQHHIHVPHDDAVAALAAGADDETEIGRDDLIERGDDAAARIAFAAVQEGQMRRVETAFERLQPVAFLDVARRVTLRRRHAASIRGREIPACARPVPYRSTPRRRARCTDRP